MPALMAPELRMQVVPGLALPFFPARPMHGVPLTSPEQALRAIEAELDAGRVVQRKMGGDRACVAAVRGAVVAQSRHGGWLKRTPSNAADFAQFGDGTCFDGEVMPGGLFHPFECLAWGGASLLRAPASERARAARLACAHLGLPWLYDLAPRGGTVAGFAAGFRRNLPACEGVVSKADSPYPVGRSASAETSEWRKMRWG